MALQPILKRFHIWRYKNISQKNFVYVLSIMVGLLAGLAAVTLKNITFTIESILEHGIIFSQNQLYFILPVIGLLLVYLLNKYIFKKKIEIGTPSYIKRAIPSVLYALLR